MRSRLEELFFAPLAPTTLALTRITLYAGVLIFYAAFIIDFPQYVMGASPAAWRPVGLFPGEFRFLYESAGQSAGWAWALDLTFKVSVVLAMIGWKFRWTSVLALVSSMSLFGFISSSGNAFRFDTILVQAQLIACFAPMAAALSVDSWRRGPAAPSGDYRWPVMLFQLYWVFVFFSSGLGKLRRSGLAWAYEDFFREYLYQTYVTRGPLIEGNWVEPLTLGLARQSSLTVICSIMVLGVELLYPLIFVRRLTLPILVFTLFFQTAVRLTLGISFFTYWILVPVWLPLIFQEGALASFVSGLSGRLAGWKKLRT